MMWVIFLVLTKLILSRPSQSESRPQSDLNALHTSLNGAMDQPLYFGRNGNTRTLTSDMSQTGQSSHGQLQVPQNTTDAVHTTDAQIVAGAQSVKKNIFYEC